MAELDLELQEGEVVEKEIKGDYWEKTLCFYSQKRGTYWFTNKRIIFRGGFIASIEIPYADIESIKTCNVGDFIQIMPTSFVTPTHLCTSVSTILSDVPISSFSSNSVILCFNTNVLSISPISLTREMLSI